MLNRPIFDHDASHNQMGHFKVDFLFLTELYALK